MRKLCVLVLLVLFAAPILLADTQDTAVFRTRMSPESEVPAVTAPGNSATATITARVIRDARGNINAATVIFDIEYTFTEARSVVGLHVHHGNAGATGDPVINTGISASSPVAAPAGTGRIVRVVDYNSTETFGLAFVTGMLAAPENYYVNLHTTTQPAGFIRGQLRATRLVFRPIMSPLHEVPAISGLDAEGAALIEVEVNRDLTTGTITSGSVVFDVDYRFPSPVTLTGLHIHSAPAGVVGNVVIGTDLNGNTRSITNATRGNIYRVVDIPATDVTGLTALAGLFSDPTQFYVNLHTTVNPGGAIRGQLSRTNFAFFNQMTGAEETPPVTTSAVANAMTYIRVDRNTTGQIIGGAVSFNVNYNMGGGPVTFTGLHIHNGKFGVAAAAVISSGIGSNNPIVDEDGIGSINIEVAVTPANATAFDSLRGLIENPENYYINLHTTTFPNGIVRAQLAREKYHFKTPMTTANEVPPATGADISGTGWITAVVSRDANGTIVGGQVTFDINFAGTGPFTFTGLHLHDGAAEVAGPATISSGLSGTNTVESATGSANLTRVVNVAATSTAGIGTLGRLITNPADVYVNLHTTTFGGGIIRSQLLPTTTVIPVAAGGTEWITSITLRNPSATASVAGMIDFFTSAGAAMPEAITDPNISFFIPPSGSVTFNTHNKGDLTSGFARVFTNGTVT
ncbi:MAG: CHRD domain-containing protein, partial [Acidobacteria bacterium]|nr:CHRD domain-containing protein [Acidobacteriota bacterium]